MEDANHKENSVKTKNIFCTCIGFKSLNLSNLKIIGKGFEKSFESGVNTTLRNQTLFESCYNKFGRLLFIFIIGIFRQSYVSACFIT